MVITMRVKLDFIVSVTEVESSIIIVVLMMMIKHNLRRNDDDDCWQFLLSCSIDFVARVVV